MNATSVGYFLPQCSYSLNLIKSKRNLRASKPIVNGSSGTSSEALYILAGVKMPFTGKR